MKIFIIDDDKEMGGVLKRYILSTKINCGVKVYYFNNVIDAINATNEIIPDLIFLDILLDGPDGFTLLNELQSYDDLAKIPVVVASSLSLEGKKFNGYNIVGYLNKSMMIPAEIQEYVREYARF